jgi:uncharacterized membrane protein
MEGTVVQSDTVVIALAAIGAVVTIINGIVLAYVTVKTRQTVAVTEKTHELVNGVSHELTETTKALGAATGFTAGEQAQRDRQSPPGQ